MKPEFNRIDFLGELTDKVTYQFQDKDVFNKFLELIISPLEDLQIQIERMIQLRGIDEATGENLDVIGRIVGQPRELISVDYYKFFAFFGYPNGETYGDVTDPSVGGVFYTEGQPSGGNFRLDDNTYRLFIKSKILKNRTASTPEELIQFLTFLYGENTPIYIKEGNAHCTLFFGRPLSTLEKNLLSFVSYELGYPSKLIPMTIGVGVEYAYFKQYKFFAFQGVPNAKGYKDADAEIGWGEEWGFNYDGQVALDTSIGGFYASYLEL